MTREELYDAMNLIADDLIEEVNTLRMRRKRRGSIVRYLSVAACICLVAGSVYVWGHMKPMDTHQDGLTESEQEQNVEQEDFTEFTQIILTVEELTDDGFIGTVTETDEFVKGTKLMVCVPQGENVEYTVGSTVNVEYTQDAIGGTTTELEDVNKDEVADESFSESAMRYRIYAERITLIEGGENE